MEYFQLIRHMIRIFNIIRYVLLCYKIYIFEFIRDYVLNFVIDFRLDKNFIPSKKYPKRKT
jgi:hypothetical protein